MHSSRSRERFLMPPSRRSNKKVFLSHSSRNRSFIVRLTPVLKRHKIPYWYSARHIVGATQWHDEIGQALSGCNWFLLVLTPDAVRSQWVKRELLFALNAARYNKRIIPLLLKPCKYSRLSWALPAFQLVDFTAGFDHGCCQLLLNTTTIPLRRKPQVRKRKRLISPIVVALPNCFSVLRALRASVVNRFSPATIEVQPSFIHEVPVLRL